MISTGDLHASMARPSVESAAQMEAQGLISRPGLSGCLTCTYRSRRSMGT